LVVLALAQTAALITVWRTAVHTELGQWFDTVALTGNRIGQDRIDGLVNRILNAMSVAALLAATAVIGFIALIRGHRHPAHPRCQPDHAGAQVQPRPA